MNRYVLEYCNIGKPYLLLRRPAFAETEREVLLPLEAHQLEDGALKEPQEIAATLAESLKGSGLVSVEVYLRSSQIYKTVLSLPVMNRIAAERLYRKEQAERALPIQSRSDECACRRYLAVRQVRRHPLGTVFQTYELPQSAVRSVRTLVRLLGARCNCVKPFGFYLQKTLPYDCTYAFFYIRRDSCTFLVMEGKQPVTMVDFAFSSQQELKSRLLPMLSRYEFEHGELTYYRMDADCPIDFSAFGLSLLGKETP